MSPRTMEKPKARKGGGDAIAHYVDWVEASSPSAALCGTRLRGVPAPPGSPVCVVCEDLRRGRA